MSPTATTATAVQVTPGNHAAMIKKKKQLGPYLLLDTIPADDDYSKLKRAVHSHTGKEVTVKLIDKGYVEKANLVDKVDLEISILKRLTHPSIVKLFDVIETQTHVGIVMESAPAGDVFDYVLKNDYVEESKAQVFFAQLISSVHYMHRKQVVHRDIKLENLMLADDEHLLVSGFAFSNRCAGDLLSTNCGSPCYAAPELLLRKEYVGSAADIWSCGVVLYAMVCGYLPFGDRGLAALKDNGNADLLYQDMLEAALTFPPRVSEDARDLMRQMLEPDPAFRCSIDVVIAHPWLAAHRAFLEKPMHLLEEEASKIIAENRESAVAVAVAAPPSPPPALTGTSLEDPPQPPAPVPEPEVPEPSAPTTTNNHQVSRVTIATPLTSPLPSPTPSPTKQAPRPSSAPLYPYHQRRVSEESPRNSNGRHLFGSLRKFIRSKSRKGRKGVFSFLHHSRDNDEPCTRVQHESLLVFHKMAEAQLLTHLTRVLDVLGMVHTTYGHHLKLECIRPAAPHPGTIYGDNNDSRQRVRFVVEICMAAAASHGLRMIDVRRIDGQETTYDFLCGKVLDTLEMLIRTAV